MLDDADKTPAFDPPDARQVVHQLPRNVPALGVEPVPRDRAQDLMAEWSDAIAAGRSGPPSKH